MIIMKENWIYLDNAATTFPKPPQMAKAVAYAIESFGNPGRGAHKLAMDAAEEIYYCRKAAAKMFGATPERVIFTSGATQSLNTAIYSLKNTDGAILISDLEHNSVLRPAISLDRELRVFSSFVDLNGPERTAAILNSIDSLSKNAAAIVTTAASNICGARIPVSDIGAYCKAKGLMLIVDGAQAGGRYELNMKRDGIDVLCLPGHKGLYGPMGCGLMILGDDVELEPLLYGGSGVDSLSPKMPALPPERYEAGTLPLPLISGLRRGIEFVEKRTIGAIRKHEERLASITSEMLTSFGARVYCKNHPGNIVLFDIEGITSENTAAFLAEHRICTRAGLHCAPLAHKTLDSEGGVRASFGAFNTERDIVSLMSVLRKLKANK